MIRAAILALLAGCSAPPVIPNPSPFDEDDPAALGPDAGATIDAAPAAEPPAPAPASISRADLERVVAAGPWSYRGAVEIEAVTEGDRLLGWRIVRWDVPWRGLEVGDVVLEVNGVVVVRPGDLDRLWEKLEGAEEVAIRLERAGVERVLRFPVLEPR